MKAGGMAITAPSAAAIGMNFIGASEGMRSTTVTRAPASTVPPMTQRRSARRHIFVVPG